MPNKNGVVSIGLNLDYDKVLKQMVTDFDQALTQISNKAQKTEYAAGIEKQVGEIRSELKGFSDDFRAELDKINNQKIDSSNFEKFESNISKKFESIEKKFAGVNTKIHDLKSQLDLLDGSDFATNMKNRFEDLSQTILQTLKGLEGIVDLTKISGKSSAINVDESSLKKYKETLTVINKLNSQVFSTPTGSWGQLKRVMNEQESLLKAQIQSYDELRIKMESLDPSSDKYLELENELVRIQAEASITAGKIQNIFNYADGKGFKPVYSDGTKSLISQADNFLGEINAFESKIQKVIRANKEAQESVRQTQTSFNTFQIKDGAVQIPIDITNSGELKEKLNSIVEELKDYIDNKPIIAKVKLTLDKSSSKGYEKNEDIDKQQIEGQNEPALDISKTIQGTYRKAAREAKQIVKTEIKKIQEEFDSVPIKIKPDSDAFKKELESMIDDSFKSIVNDTTGLNVNSKLEKLVENLKEVSSALSGNDNFKFGLDEDSIDRITKAIQNMADMIQRAFKVASNADIEAQWGSIEGKFKAVANELGHIDARSNKNKDVMRELAAEYKKYLDMGGTRKISDITGDEDTLQRITGYYEDLGKAIQDVTQKQEQQSKQRSASSGDKDAIKGVTRENKSLEGQADKTSKALINEGKSAETAAGKFRKLAKEKGAAVYANRELAKAAKDTADALEREAQIRKQTGTKTGKGAIDPDTYQNSALIWRKNIEQSLLDGGQYGEVFGSQISQGANGVVTFKAYVKDLNDEWQVLTATVNKFGNITSPKIQEATAKQVIAIERAKIAWEKYIEAMASGDKERTFLDRTNLELYIEDILKAEDSLDRFKVKKVALSSGGRLAITSEVEEANGQIKTFTAYFSSVDDIIDETTGSVKNLSSVLEDAFDSGQFTVSTRRLADDAQGVFDKFMLNNRGNTNLSYIASDLEALEKTIVNISTQDGLDTFKRNLSDIGDRLNFVSKASRAFSLFELNNKDDANYSEITAEVTAMFNSIGNTDSQDKLDKFNSNLSGLIDRLKTIAADNKLGELFQTNQSFTDIKEVSDNLDILLADIGEVNTKSIEIKGLSKLTAEVKDANGEIHKMTVSLDSKNSARYVDDGIKPTPFNAEELEGYISKITEATRALEDFNTKYKVSLKSDGSLSITKEVQEANGEIRTFVANFKDIDSVIDTTTDSVKDLGIVLKDAFDSGKVSSKSRNLVKEAQEAFATFEKSGKGKSGFKYISDDIDNLKNKINEIKDLQGLDEFNQDLEKLSDRLKLISSAEDYFNKLKKYEGGSNWSQVSDEVDRLRQSVVAIKDQDGLDKLKQDIDGIVSKLTNISKDAKLGEIIDKSKTFGDINEVRANIDSLLASMGKVDEKSLRVDGVDKLTAEVKAANGEIRKITVSLDSNSFARYVDNGIVQFGRLRAAAEGVFKGIKDMVRIYLSPQDFIRYFRQGFDTVKEIDTAMTELKKVSDAPIDDIVAYFDDATASAKKLGSSVTDMIAATADWSRMGYNLPDSRELGEVAVLYKNVGDGIDIDTANESLVSTIQGFQLQAKDAMSVIDSFNEVSNNYAISSAGIGEALKRSAAAFNAANTDLNKSIALITAGNEIVQSPEKVGTMWQTVSARIRGTKSELEELGEETENVLSTSKLRSLVMGYTNVDIMKDANTYKDMYTIISEIGEKWHELEDMERAALLEGLAGKKQSNTLAAVLNNADRLKEIYETAEGSAGSAMREQERYSQSLQYSLDQLTSHGEEFWQTFINKDDVKDFINLLNGLIEKVTKVVDVFGSVPTTLGLLSGFKAIKNEGIIQTTTNELGQTRLTGAGLAKDIFSGNFFKRQSVVSDADISALEAYNTKIEEGIEPSIAFNDTMMDTSDAAKHIAKSANGAAVNIGAIQKTSKAAAAGMKALSVAANIGLTILASFAVSAIIDWIDDLVHAQEIAIEKAEEINTKFKEQQSTLSSNKKTIDSISADYEKLSKGVSDTGANVSLSTEEYTRYNNIVNQIADMFPTMVRGYTEEGNAIIAHKGNVEELTKAYKEQAKAARDGLISKGDDVFAGAEAEIDQLNEKIKTNEAAQWLLNGGKVYHGVDAAKNPFDGNIIQKAEELLKDQGVVRQTQTYADGTSEETYKLISPYNKTTQSYDDPLPEEIRVRAEKRNNLERDYNLLLAQREGILSKTNSVIQAYLENEITYDSQSEDIKNLISILSSSLDPANFDFDDDKMKAWVKTNILIPISSASPETKKAISELFSLDKTKLPAKEWESQVNSLINSIVGGLTFKNEDEKQSFIKNLKIQLGFEFTVDGKTTNEALIEGIEKKFGDKFKDEINRLSEGELKILAGLDISLENIKSWAEIRILIANAGKEISKVKVTLSDLASTSDNIKVVSAAFKELSDNGYITTKTLGEIQTATGLSNDEWAEYESKLIGAKAGSSEFNQIMSNLTYKILDNAFANKDLNDLTEEQIALTLKENGVLNASAVAHEWLAKAKAKEKVTTIELVNGVELNTAALASEASACGITKNAYLELVAKEILFNRNDLDVDDKIKKLNQIAIAAGIAGINMDTLNRKFGSQSEINAYVESTGGSVVTGAKPVVNSAMQDWLEFKGLLAAPTEYVLPDGTKTKDINDYMKQVAMSNLVKDISNLSNNVTIPSFSGGSGSGSDTTPSYENPVDAIINRINLGGIELEQQEERIQNALEIAEIEKDYEKQISLTNDLITARTKRINELNAANAGLHNEAEYLRNNNPWNEETWFDSQGEATEAYYNVLNSAKTKAEQEKIKSLFDDIQKYKKAYIENSKEISTLTKQILQDEASVWDARREIFDERMALSDDYIQHSIDFGWENGDTEIKARKRVLDWVQSDYYRSLIKEDKEYYKILEENTLKYNDALENEFNRATEFGSSYFESKKTLLQSYYDVTNSIAEAQHEINKELETSMSMYEYLDEDTRKLLFNQEDYNELSEELIDIQYRADKLQRQYKRDLDTATLDTIEQITSNYQMQYETLMKSYEIAKADLEIAKKKQKLNNVLNERNVRMFVNGSWQWVADTEQVANAKAELADAEYAKRVEESGLTQQESINNLTKQQDELGVVVKKFESGVIDLQEAVRLASTAIGYIPQAMEDMLDNVRVSTRSSSSSSSKSSGSKSYNGISYDSGTNYMTNILTASSEAEVIANNTARNAKILGDGMLGSQTPLTNESAIEAWKNAKGHASGTRYTPGGLTKMGEEGFEAYINSTGRLIPITLPTIGNIESGGVVFNTDQMKNLRTMWDMSNLKFDNNNTPIETAQPQQIDQSQDNRIIINGMTVDSGSADGQALISALRRYVGNH